MSTDGGRPPGDGEDDPFAFGPDGEDDAPAPGDDASTSGDDGSVVRGRRVRRPSSEIAAEAEAARRARIRQTSAEASERARSIGVRWLAVALIVFVVIIGITTITGGRDAQGGDVQAGETLPAFAAPLVSQPRLKNEDVNLATRSGQGEAGNRAACSIRDRSVVTSCSLLARGPLVVVLFSRGIDSCVGAVDLLDSARTRYPGLGALAVSLLGRHDSTGETARDRRWTLPVVYDRDGALASVLGAPACPLVLFVRPDGTVQQRIIGSLDRAELDRGIRALLAPRPGAATTVDAAPAGR
ncbi:hypothetical protein [Patulibacter sp.]|uniref:TlpA family protein disulfide reductase n=1 Tax=Patulibacter sp. TaxID=1912859 RepID=UPI0027209BF6|nr:hypothetical protein [Patulibacter sp.]MDO9408707.1 hypothetical protein [Patulibacter sp.]